MKSIKCSPMWRVMYAPTTCHQAEPQPELRCSSCGHEPPPPPPPKPPSNAAAMAAVQARLAPRRAKVAEMYQQGILPLVIAEQLGLSSMVVYADLAIAGLAPGKRRILPDTVQRIITMRQAGMTITQIERALGVCHLTVQRHTERAGLPTLSTQMTAARRDAFRLYHALRPLGWSYQRIADRAGVSRATLHRWVHDAGLQQGDARQTRHRAPQATTASHSAPNAPKHT